MTKKHVASLALTAAALALVLACNLRPKEGATCKAAKGTCLSATDALYCVGLDVGAGKYERLRCLGVDGCKETMGNFACDTRVTELSSACPESLQGNSACSADAKTMLRCNRHRWELEGNCLGPAGCAEDGKNVRCDESIGSPGDACTDDGRMACTLDGKTRLVCNHKKMVPDAACVGPAGCHVEGSDVLCDGNTQLEGAPCQPDGAIGCAADRKTRLLCKDGILGSPVECHGPNGCARQDDKVYCDRSVAAEGEPCISEGAAACSVDGAKMLVCKSGTYVAHHACHARCKVSGSTGPGQPFGVEC
jgi:hypothetical protein